MRIPASISPLTYIATNITSYPDRLAKFVFITLYTYCKCFCYDVIMYSTLLIKLLKGGEMK